MIDLCVRRSSRPVPLGGVRFLMSEVPLFLREELLEGGEVFRRVDVWRRRGYQPHPDLEILWCGGSGFASFRKLTHRNFSQVNLSQLLSHPDLEILSSEEGVRTVSKRARLGREQK